MNEKTLVELTIEYHKTFGDPVPTHLGGSVDERKRLIVQAIKSNEPLSEERLIENE